MEEEWIVKSNRLNSISSVTCQTFFRERQHETVQIPYISHDVVQTVPVVVVAAAPVVPPITLPYNIVVRSVALARSNRS
jgi:hypothetical protein